MSIDFKGNYFFNSHDPIVSYADDVIAIIDSLNDLKSFDIWFRKQSNIQRSVINYKKIMFLIIHPELDNSTISDEFSINDKKIISRNISGLILGVIFSENGEWKEHRRLILNKFKKSAYILMELIRAKGIVTINQALELWRSTIRSQVEYAAFCWGLLPLSDFERIQYDFLRCLFGLGSCSSKAFLLYESDLQTLFMRRKINVLNFWAKLTTLKDCSPAKYTYNSLKKKKGYTWCSRIKLSLRQFNMCKYRPLQGENLDVCKFKR